MKPAIERVADLIGESYGVAELTPSDSADLATPVRAIMCGANGDVTVVYLNGYTQQFAVLAGDVIPPVDIPIARVKATGTTLTASQLLGVLIKANP